MKKISSSFLKSLNWLLTSVLMLLGFSTCDSEPGAAMYVLLMPTLQSKEKS